MTSDPNPANAGQPPAVRPPPVPKAPVGAGFLLLILSLLFLVAPLPFTSIVGVPLAVATMIVSVLCMARDRVGWGTILFLGATAGSVVALTLSVAMMTVLFGATIASAGNTASSLFQDARRSMEERMDGMNPMKGFDPAKFMNEPPDPEAEP